MKERPLNDKDAHLALKQADLATQEKYADIRSRMRAKVTVTKHERTFIKSIRMNGRRLDKEMKQEGFERLFSEKDD